MHYFCLLSLTYVNMLSINPIRLEIIENFILGVICLILLIKKRFTDGGYVFCIKYIWDPDTDSGSEDSYIYDFDYILDFQPHLNESQLISIANNID